MTSTYQWTGSTTPESTQHTGNQGTCASHLRSSLTGTLGLVALASLNTFPKQVLSLGELGCVHEGHEFPQDGSTTETLTSYLNSLTLCLCVYNVTIPCLASFSLGN